MNNAYDVKYCEITFFDTKKYFLPPGFYLRCKLFKWFNMLNNILNNVLFLFISTFIDFFMIRYSYKLVEKKKAMNCPHLADAIQYKNKLNKLIITNGTLFFFSHIPEFVVTLIVLFRKSPDFVNFCKMDFDCNHLIEMAQAFHFISISFQLFILLIFDHNFKNCFYCKKIKTQRYIGKWG